MIEIITFITQDKIVFWALQAFIIGLSLFAFVRDYLHKGSGLAVTRGKESRERLRIAVSGFTSVILALIISVSTEAQGHKVFMTIVDLICIYYLGLFNSWTRNKIIWIYTKFENKVENL